MSAAAVSHDAQSLHPQGSTNERICQDGIEQWNREMEEMTAGPKELAPKAEVVAPALTEETPRVKVVAPSVDVSPPAQRDARSRRSELRSLQIDAADVKRKVAEPPMALLPKVVRQFVKEACIEFNMPTDMGLPFALATIAGAIGNRRSIHVKHSWYASPALWVAIVARPGAGKTPLMEYIMEPLTRWDEEREVEWEYLKKALEEDNTEKSLKNSEIPPAPRVMANNITVEELSRLFSQNPNGLTLARDELRGFVEAMGQYKGGGSGADRSDYLSMWSGASYTIDRKGSESFRVKHPCLTVVGGIQPGLVHKLMSKDGDDGFLDRVLSVHAEPLKKKWHTKAVSLGTHEAWSQAIDNILALKMQPAGYPVVVEMSDAARTRYGELYSQHAETQERTDFNYRMFGVWAKLEIYAARLTLGLHMIKQASGETTSQQVEVSTVEAAWALVRWFAAHAAVTRGLLEETPEDRLAGALVSWMRKHGGQTSLRELVHGHAVGIRSYSVAKDAMDILIDRGIVMALPGKRQDSSIYKLASAEELAAAA